MTVTLNEILKDHQILDARELSTFERQSGDGDCHLKQVLMREGAFTRQQLLLILENHFFCPSVNLQETEYDPEPLLLLPAVSSGHRRREFSRASPARMTSSKKSSRSSACADSSSIA